MDGTIKNIRVTVTEDEFDRLDEAKGERTWREAMLEDMADGGDDG